MGLLAAGRLLRLPLDLWSELHISRRKVVLTADKGVTGQDMKLIESLRHSCHSLLRLWKQYHGVDRASFRRGEWRHIGNVQEHFKHAPSMLDTEELQLLYWLTSKNFRGCGTIVELGSFLGGSTCALCTGLTENCAITSVNSLVHSYDRFLMEEYFTSALEWLGENVDIGGSFLRVYERMIDDFRHAVNIHSGDIMQSSYNSGPIEILFIDICKSWEINAKVVSEFFRHLIPGRSIVVQQDYVHHWHYWLHLTMEFLRDYFEPIGRVKKGHSEIFLNTRRIPESLLQLDFRKCPQQDKIAAYDRILTRFPEDNWQRVSMTVANAVMLLLDHSNLEAADRVFQQIDCSKYEHHSAAEGWTWRGILCYKVLADQIRNKAA